MQPEEHGGCFLSILSDTRLLILHDFQEPTLDMAKGVILLVFKIGERAIASLWRCLACSTNAYRRGFSGMKRKNTLQTNLMLPASFKVIFVQKTLFDP